MLLLDSMERFTEQGIRLAGQLIANLLTGSRCSHINILLVVQYESAAQLVARLSEAGIDRSKLDLTPIECPQVPAVRNVLKEIHGIPWATLHQDMRPLLRNLKILDWVVRAAESGSHFDDAKVTGLIPANRLFMEPVDRR